MESVRDGDSSQNEHPAKQKPFMGGRWIIQEN